MTTVTSHSAVTTKPAALPLRKSQHLTTELFRNRSDIPSFVSEHPVFKKAHRISKIFPHVGLKNFTESCEMVKQLVDLKKENFITNLVTAMYTNLVAGRDRAKIIADEAQFLIEGGAHKEQLDNLQAHYNLAHIVQEIIPQVDIYNGAYDQAVQISNGRVALKLVTPVKDLAGEVLFRENESLFKVFNKLRTQFQTLKLEFINLEELNEFKTFNNENIPNKDFKVVFSSEGEEGAWDLLTMSMRGIKSCQRWDGEWHRCLIGSVISCYVGIVYITSGAEIDFTYNEPVGNKVITGKGAKMLRRALVRYVIDKDEDKPCLLIDRIYPPPAQGAPEDQQTVDIFKKALASKTSLPVHFAPQMGNKIRHFYVPYENIRNDVAEKDWSYQDHPLKTNLDFNMNNMSSTEDVTRYINAFRSKLLTILGERFRLILTNRVGVNEEIARTISNIRLNIGTTTSFSEQILEHAVPRNISITTGITDDPRNHYRRYLVQLISGIKAIQKNNHDHFINLVKQSTSREVNCKVFSDFIFNDLIKTAVLQELKSLIN